MSAACAIPLRLTAAAMTWSRKSAGARKPPAELVALLSRAVLGRGQLVEDLVAKLAAAEEVGGRHRQVAPEGEIDVSLADGAPVVAVLGVRAGSVLPRPVGGGSGCVRASHEV